MTEPAARSEIDSAARRAPTNEAIFDTRDGPCVVAFFDSKGEMTLITGYQSEDGHFAKRMIATKRDAIREVDPDGAALFAHLVRDDPLAHCKAALIAFVSQHGREPRHLHVF